MKKVFLRIPIIMAGTIFAGIQIIITFYCMKYSFVLPKNRIIIVELIYYLFVLLIIYLLGIFEKRTVNIEETMKEKRNESELLLIQAERIFAELKGSKYEKHAKRIVEGIQYSVPAKGEATKEYDNSIIQLLEQINNAINQRNGELIEKYMKEIINLINERNTINKRG